MIAGFPNGTPLRRGLHVHLQPRRRGAVPAHDLQGGAAGGARDRGAGRRGGGGGLAPPARGRRPGGRSCSPGSPACSRSRRGRSCAAARSTTRCSGSASRRRGRRRDRTSTARCRATRGRSCSPGQLFAFYRWGATIDPILPALTDRPVAVRNIVPYADLHAIDLLWTTDALVQERRALPGQLRPLLGLLGAGAVIAATDDDRTAQRRPAARERGGGARRAAGLGLRPSASYGRVRGFPPAAGELGAQRPLPEVRRYDLPAGRGIVRVEPAGPPVVVDGSAAALAGLAAFGALPRHAPILYAGDRTPAQLRADWPAAARSWSRTPTAGGSSSRRGCARTPARRSRPATRSPRTPPCSTRSRAGAPTTRRSRGSAASPTCARRSPRASRSSPSTGPFAAFDGDPRTAWLADRNLDVPRRRLDVGFTAPRDVPYVEVLPYSDPRGTVTSVAVGGHTLPGARRLEPPAGAAARRALAAAAHRRRAPAGARLRRRRRLRRGADPRRARHGGAAPAGGGRARARGPRPRAGRPHLPLPAHHRRRPVRARPVRRAGAGRAGARPRRRRARPARASFSPPAARSWRADGWYTVSPSAPDHELDEVANTHGDARFDSSGRFDGRPGFRASRAFDGGRGARVGRRVGARPRGVAGVDRPARGDRATSHPDPGPRARALPDPRAAALVGREHPGAGGRPRRERRAARAGDGPRVPAGDPRRPLPGGDRQPRAPAPRGGDRRAARDGADQRRVERPDPRGLRLHRGDRRRRPSAAGDAPGRHGRRPRRRAPAARAPCGPPVALPAGPRRLVSEPGLFAPLPAAAARTGAGRTGRSGRRRPRPRPGHVGPRRARPRARRADGTVVARARRELQPRLARDLRRRLARRAAGDRRVRQRLARARELPLGALRLRAQPAGLLGLRHLRARVPAAARAAPAPPPGPRAGRRAGAAARRPRRPGPLAAGPRAGRRGSRWAWRSASCSRSARAW